MNWDDMRIFLAVVNAGSLSGAAKALKVTQPTVGRRLKGLEDKLAVRLFDWLPEGFVPTSAGMELLPLAEAMELTALAVERRRTSLADGAKGTVRLSVWETLAQLLADHLADLRARLPEIEIELSVTHIHANLSRREADLLIRECLPDNPGLIARRVASYTFAVYGARDYVASHPAARGDARYSQCEWVGFDEDHAYFHNQSWLLDRLGGAQPGIRVNNGMVIHEAVRKSAGLGVLPCFVADPDPGLVRLSPPIEELIRNLHLVVHRDVRKSPAVRAVIDALAEIFKAEGPRLLGRAEASRVACADRPMKTDMRGSDDRLNQASGGIATFLRSDYEPDPTDFDADIAVFGVPFDAGSPFMGGSRFAPRSLREHSLRFGGRTGFFDIESGREYLTHEIANRRIVDLGDADILPTNVEGSFENVTALARAALSQGALPVALGGDHAISYPVVRAFDGPLHVVHFDAHLDYGAPAKGMTYTNGMPFRLIHQLDQVTGLTQVGIRSLRNKKSDYDDAIAAGSRIVGMSELGRLGPEGTAALVPEGARCYVSIDVDALDMTLIPGCVSAEPGGLSYADLRDTFAAIAARSEIVGFDFVEVNPPLDVATGVTSYLGAHLVIECLGLICAQPWWRARRR